MSAPKETAKKCPRCGGPLALFEHDLGALSRADNETIVCSPCGESESHAPARSDDGLTATGKAWWPS